MPVQVKKFEPRLTRQSADQGVTALATKVDENLLMLKRFLSDLTANVNQVLNQFDVSVGSTAAATGSGGTLDFSSDGLQDTTGAETWRDERVFDFSGAAAPAFTLSLACLGMSTAGTGIARVRVGGTSHAPDGAVVALAYLIGSSFTLVTVPPRTGVNPGGPALVKLTVQSSAAGQKAQIKAVSISIR